MRKLLTIAAAVALLALGSAHQAKAFDNSLMVGSSGASLGVVPVAFMVGIPALIVAGIISNEQAKAQGKVAQASDLGAERRAVLTHEFNIAMGVADDAQTTAMLASAAR